MHTSPRPVLAQVRYTKGYTLIELIVVIALIGILSAVILGTLMTPRTKGADAAVKANLGTIRTQSAIYYDTNRGYSLNTVGVYPTYSAVTAGSCTLASSLFADTTVSSAITAADNASTGAAICSIGASTATVPSATWAVYVPLTSGGWCADSAGKSQASAPLTGAACP